MAANSGRNVTFPAMALVRSRVETVACQWTLSAAASIQSVSKCGSFPVWSLPSAGSTNLRRFASMSRVSTSPLEVLANAPGRSFRAGKAVGRVFACIVSGNHRQARTPDDHLQPLGVNSP